MDSTQDSAHNQPPKRSNLKSYLSDIALKTGLSEQEVAKVSRLIFKKIRVAIEEGETFHTPTLVIQSVSKPPKPENEKLRLEMEVENKKHENRTWRLENLNLKT